MAKNPVRYSLVDAFTDSAFKGNPAAICFLEEAKDDQWLRSVTAEFNSPITCFVTRLTESNQDRTRSPIPRFRLRWFLTTAEVELCGHGTLATAHAVFASREIDSNTIEFVTLSGILTAKRIPDHSKTQNEGFFIELNLPCDPSNEFVSADSLLVRKALGEETPIVAIRRTATDKIIVVLPSAKYVADLKPDFNAMEKCPGMGIGVTAVSPPETGFDFQSRFFAPKVKVNEDQVCGSAHCALAVYWSMELGKSDFVAYQSSPRGGVVKLHLDEENQRVLLQGKACTVMEGVILV